MKKARRMRRRRRRNIPGFSIPVLLIAASYMVTLGSQIVTQYPQLVFYFVLLLGASFSFKIYKRYKERRILRLSGVNDIDKMNGFQFEYYVRELCQANGYEAKVTKAQGDFGADLILQKDRNRIVVQVKRYKGKVGIKAVQEVVASKSYYNAEEAWIITNSFFTNSAMELATYNHVRLIDRKELIQMAAIMNPYIQATQEHVIRTTANNEVVCDKCGSEMKIRKGPSGLFYGCTNFPTCRGTKPLESA
ncbi:restriction endonuclease [Ectobacillus antri]|uniref:restriction endonuclease n=1 Tax=Ectobacillus antri TaxID=2486280 RepID=UPI0013DE1CC3|nr:restriction endonuclease [Ectobacillus antri]